MAKPGPAPQPTDKRIRKGNPGGRPLPKNEPKPRIPRGIPGAPGHLNKLAAKEWRRMAKALYPTGVMTVIDKSCLEGYCVEYSKWLHANKQIEEHGMLVTAQSGYQAQSPWLQISNKAQGEMRKWLCEIGATPASRSRVEVVHHAKMDPAKDYIAKGKKMEVVK